MKCKDKVSVFLWYHWVTGFQHFKITYWSRQPLKMRLFHWFETLEHSILSQKNRNLSCIAAKTWSLQMGSCDNYWWVRKDFFVCLKVFFWTHLASIEENNGYLRIADPLVEIWTGFLPNKSQFVGSVLVHCPSINCITYSRLHMYYTRTSCK